MEWKMAERGRLRGDFRKPIWSAVRFLAARKKRWKRCERLFMVGARSSIDGMFKSRVVRHDAKWVRVVVGVWRRWRVDSGLSCGAVKFMFVFVGRRARLRVVIALVQASSQV
jgi:hypothetical protein